MWRWGLIAEKQPRDQTGTCHAAREIAAARIKAAELDEIPVRRNIAVPTENATGALPEIGNDHDISFVVSGAGFDPCFPLAHFIGRSQVCISVSAPISKPRNLWIRKKLTTPAIASDPYTAEAPSLRMS